jgi:hypothetical protein
MAQFTAEVFQNEFLPLGGTDVHAVVAVTAIDTGGAAASQTEVGEVVIVDTSGSMEQPGSKIRAAREAAGVAIDGIADGTWFALIAGTEVARVAYPENGSELVRMDAEHRRHARAVTKQLQANGGTAIGSWLRLASALFASSPAVQRHAILLTDGRNESETAATFNRAVREAKGVFQCDPRGVGENWEVEELRSIATELLGTVDIIADPEDMAVDFAEMTAMAMGRGVTEAKLRVWAPQGAEILFVRQVAPQIEQMDVRRVDVNPLTGEYTTGAWGDESREYHVAVRVPAKTAGQEQLAARVQVVIDDAVVAQGLIRAIWSDDSTLTTKINPAVAHYTGQTELAQAIQDGLAAKSAGDVDTATNKLGRALELAQQTGNDEATSRLKKVVEVDLDTGTVRLKKQVAPIDEMALDTRSTKTTRVK